MYSQQAKQDALDLWFSMPGEMSVDDFAAELGYPSGSTLRNWIKADPRHDPDKCQYRSKPVLPKLEAIRRVAEGATAAQAARETGLTPQQVRYSVGRYARRVFPSSTASPFLLFLAGAGSSAAVPPRAYLPTL